MFEKLNAPALYVANQAALALYANADTSGLVLSSGSGITEVVPVLDGNTLKHAVTTVRNALDILYPLPTKFKDNQCLSVNVQLSSLDTIMGLVLSISIPLHNTKGQVYGASWYH